MRITIELDAVNNTAMTTTEPSDSKIVAPLATAVKSIDAGGAPSSLHSSSVETTSTTADMLAASRPNAQSAGSAPNF